MRFRLRKYNRIICFILCVLMMFESRGVTSLAAGTDAECDIPSKEETECQGESMSTLDGEDCSVSAGVLEQSASEEIYASGVYYGMDWSVTSSGVLTISGKYNPDSVGKSWSGCGDKITSVKVSATGVGSTYKWFEDLTNLKSVDLRGFDSGTVLDMSYMFYGCLALSNIQFGELKTYNVKNMSYMFYGCSSLKNINLSSFNTSKVTSMRYMFAKCQSLSKIDLSGFDTAKVTDMSGMFYGCNKAVSINTGKFNTCNVTDMSAMFEDCQSLKKAAVSGFKTDKVVNMSSMFQNCSVLKSLDLDSFSTHNVKYMSAMFSGCISMENLDLSAFNTSQVTSMAHMFSDCQSLKNIVLGSFRTYYVTNMDGMFFKCYNVENLDLSTFSMMRVTSAEAMIGRMGALKEIKTPTELKVLVDLPMEMKNASGIRYTTLPTGQSSSFTFEQISYDIAVIEDQIYTGKAIRPEVVVSKDDEILVYGTDYTVSYKNNKNVAPFDADKAPTVVVKGKGRFSGTITRSFNITAKELTADNILVKDMFYSHTGKVQKKIPSVTIDGIVLKHKKDFIVTYPDTSAGAYKDPGTYAIQIQGIGNYTGSYEVKMRILGSREVHAKNLKIGTIPVCYYEYGKTIKPTPKVSYQGKVLTLGKDYSIGYENNDKVGTATLTITGLQNEQGCYVCGSVSKTFRIKGIGIQKATVSYEKTATYSGRGICPEVQLIYDQRTLVIGKDYTVTYLNNTNVGKATILINGCGEFSGSVKKYFAIKPDVGVGDLLTISLRDADGCIDFTQKGATPEVVVTYYDKVLKQGVDYTLSYKNNKAIAASDSKKPPTVTVKGIGNYSFKRSVNFTIQKKNLDDADINFVVNDKVRTESDLRSKPVITDHAGAVLTLNVDYKIIGYTIGGIPYDKNNIPKDATRGIVTVMGIGGYAGQVSIMYRIADQNIRDTIVLAKNLEFNGGNAEYTPELIAYGALVIRDRTTGEELVCGEDFEIVGYKNNTRRGTARATIKGLGDYGGTKVFQFKIVRQNLVK